MIDKLEFVQLTKCSKYFVQYPMVSVQLFAGLVTGGAPVGRDDEPVGYC